MLLGSFDCGSDVGVWIVDVLITSSVVVSIKMSGTGSTYGFCNSF